MRRQAKKRQWKLWTVLSCLLVAIFLSCLGYRYQTADISASPEFSTLAVTANAPTRLPWPSYGQAAIAHTELGVLETHGASTQQPTASTAKVITMLALMKKKPFSKGEQGETIRMTQEDVNRYTQYVARNGSTVAVQSGQTMTQYQAMQAVLLASSNNHADSLAIWAFGSLDAYKKYATEILASYGLTQTIIGDDASGLSATTMSTAQDLAIIGLKALEEPVIAEIMRQSSATISPIGTMVNTNRLLVHDAIVGVKTGETVEAGGVFILAGSHIAKGETSYIVVVVMGANLGSDAQIASHELFRAASRQLSYSELIKKDQQLGVYKPSWHDHQIPIVAAESLSMYVWGKQPSIEARGVMLGEVGADLVAGKVSVESGEDKKSVPLKIKEPAASPSAWWRVMRP